MKYVFTSSQIYGGLGLLAIVQMCSFSMFFCLIPTTLRKTFWSTQTAKQFICSNLLEQTDDRRKFDAFTVHKSLYAPMKKRSKRG